MTILHTTMDRLKRAMADKPDARQVTLNRSTVEAMLAALEAQAAELARLRAHTAAQPAPDAVAEAIDVLGNIAAMGYSDDPAVQANIARMAVEMARSARSTYFKGHQP